MVTVGMEMIPMGVVSAMMMFFFLLGFLNGLFTHLGLDRFFVKGRCFPLFEGDRSGWADRQTVAESVTIVVAKKLRFAVNHADRALVTGLCAQAAAIAEFFVDFDNLSDHIYILTSFAS